MQKFIVVLSHTSKWFYFFKKIKPNHFFFFFEKWRARVFFPVTHPVSFFFFSLWMCSHSISLAGWFWGRTSVCMCVQWLVAVICAVIAWRNPVVCERSPQNGNTRQQHSRTMKQCGKRLCREWGGKGKEKRRRRECQLRDGEIVWLPVALVGFVSSNAHSSVLDNNNIFQFQTHLNPFSPYAVYQFVLFPIFNFWKNSQKKKAIKGKLPVILFCFVPYSTEPRDDIGRATARHIKQ